MSIKPTSYVGTSEEYAATAVALKKMVTFPPVLYPVLVAPYIWEISKGIYTFVDETEQFYEAEYQSIDAAQAGLKLYGDWL